MQSLHGARATTAARPLGTSAYQCQPSGRLRLPVGASKLLPRLQVRHASSPASSEPLQKTPLYDLHLAHGAKMVPFGGFHMPVQYSAQSVSQSHIFTRTEASIFDVGHMVQRLFKGPGAAAFLQRLTPSNLEALGVHRSTLSVLLHADGSGGIVDDTILTKLTDDTFYVVTNAACREKDDKYLGEELAKWNTEAGHENLQATQEQLDGWGLVALQGPGAEAILEGVLADLGSLDLKELFFGQSAYAKLKLPGAGSSSPVLISRGGYTGEDGFEISIPVGETVGVTETLLSAGPEKVQLAGLGARDSLRLEAGMCLYGHDLDDHTTPVEAGLSWIIPKERRTADAGFYGADRIAAQLVPRSKGGAGVATRRVGLLVDGAPAREGAEIVSRSDEDAANVGRVTSGCPSPTLGKNIAMGYVKDGLHKSGTEVAVLVRGRKRNAVVTKMPFVPTKYWKGAA
ncbi:glycine cleavage system T protein [Thozetella sp. PMI_491]|nr:glycine cleavage system T protein [Thozetella sp. PMI_491]